MRKTYDTMILGCGEAGVFAGYELIRRNPGMKVLIVDQGQDIYHRSCPIVAGKVKSCIQCKVCGTMCGFGGAGAFSDGKYNITNQFGGTLHEYIGKKQALELMEEEQGEEQGCGHQRGVESRLYIAELSAGDDCDGLDDPLAGDHQHPGRHLDADAEAQHGQRQQPHGQHTDLHPGEESHAHINEQAEHHIHSNL